jgi:hypothetical protein
MRTIQKYEFNSSIAAIIASIVQIVFFVFVAERNNNEPVFPLLFIGFAFVIFPTIVISICSHLHIKEGSKVSFGIVLSLGIIFVCVHWVRAFLHSYMGAGVALMLVAILPGFFVACTVIFAIMNSSSQSPLTDNRLS